MEAKHYLEGLKVLFLSGLYFLVWDEFFSMTLGPAFLFFFCLGLYFGFTDSFIKNIFHLSLGITTATLIFLFLNPQSAILPPAPRWNVAIVVTLATLSGISLSRVARIYLSLFKAN